ncbi:response regulator [Aestuariispira insulae]|uniref:Winged helix family two component transcriptional regulator n=1 Tax=Aestuariispira insulae TaxID=1461337 RepID=A0A3D9HY18_9PROT|nr:response regulator transcription factor [Aestuariispira insulae]RED54309.1 winged helix family two component transcriptional regulator [Aestuariispira insulae]
MMDEVHILVVDDDTEIRDLLQRFLSKEGFRVTTAADTQEAREKMRAFQFDLMVVDVMMPGESGLEFTRSLRANSAVPILMLTAMTETEARIEGLQAGADDYLPKPFEPLELVLRIQSILRRAQPASDDVEQADTIRLGNAEFDLTREMLLRGDLPVKLTTTETALLKALATAAGRIMSREELTETCQIDGGDRTVDVQVTRLRRKIEEDPKVPRYLHTVRGRGYVLRPDG